MCTDFIRECRVILGRLLRTHDPANISTFDDHVAEGGWMQRLSDLRTTVGLWLRRDQYYDFWEESLKYASPCRPKSHDPISIQ
jgi:hypothetical protein